MGSPHKTKAFSDAPASAQEPGFGEMRQDLRRITTSLFQKILQITGRVSEIVGCQSRALGDTGEHARPDFLAIVEGENEIRPALTGKNAVRCPTLSFDHPTERE